MNGLSVRYVVVSALDIAGLNPGVVSDKADGSHVLFDAEQRVFRRAGLKSDDL